jgi:hypothetical protein
MSASILCKHCADWLGGDMVFDDMALAEKYAQEKGWVLSLHGDGKWVCPKCKATKRDY